MSNEYPIALLKHPGPVEIQGHSLDYKTAGNEDEVKEALADGWHLSVEDAVATIDRRGEVQLDAEENPADFVNSAPDQLSDVSEHDNSEDEVSDAEEELQLDELSKSELLTKAKSLGIPAKGTWGEEKLKEEIAKVGK
jgi:hypothetical protein